MKRRVIVLLGIILSLVMILPIGIGYAISPNEQAKISAQEWFQANKESIVKPTLISLGYATENEADSAYLGDLILNYTIPINTFTSDKNISQQMEQMQFYDFPIMSGDKILTDFTYYLENGKWQRIDIGGYMSKNLYNMAKNNRIAPNDIKVLRFGGQPFLFAETGTGEIGYSPYIVDNEIGLGEGSTVTGSILKSHMLKRQTDYKERGKKRG